MFEHYYKKIKYWFLHRFHPNHRYHVLKLHKPGYADPRHQMILAIMKTMERYLDELREETGNYDHTNIEVVVEQIEYYTDLLEEDGDFLKDYAERQIKFYNDLYEVVVWWDIVKDNDKLDIYSATEALYLPDFYASFLSTENVDYFLIKTVMLRQEMWT